MKRVLLFAGYQILLLVAVFTLQKFNGGKYGTVILGYLLQFWTFALRPLWFFSLVIAVCGLRRKRRFLAFSVRLLGYTMLFYLLALLLVNMIEVIFPLEKLPFTGIEPGESDFTFSWLGLLDNTLAITHFLPLRKGYGFLLVLSLLAILLGLLLAPDREVAAPTYNLCDSLSRLSYRLNGIILHFIFLPLTWMAFLQIGPLKTLSITTYLRPLLLFALSFILLVVLLALAARLLRPKNQPYWQIVLHSHSLLTALISGDSGLTLSSLFYSQREQAQLSRTHSGLATPALFLLGRVGSAVMIALSFAVVYASQNRWPMAISEILYWRLLLPFALALLFVVLDFGGIAIPLSLLFTLYGEGLSYGLALLLPLLPIIQRLAACLDALVIVLINQLLVGYEESGSRRR